jgi:hypothetical protein
MRRMIAFLGAGLAGATTLTLLTLSHAWRRARLPAVTQTLPIPRSAL